MNEDQAAVVPDSFEMPVLNAEPIQAVEDEVIKTTSQEDKELAALNGMNGWKRITREFTDDIQLFKTGGFIKDIEKLPLEEVGKLFVIHQTVATMLQKYLDKVEAATKAVVENERGK